jgi:integrase
MPLSYITTKHIHDWLENYPDYPVAKHKSYTLLKSIFNTACAPNLEGYSVLEKNPCTISLPKPKRQKETVVATTEELNNLYKAMPDKLALSIYLSGIMGLRIGEVCGLQVKSVDFAYGVVRVRKQLQRPNVVGKLELVDRLKTDASRRDVPIPASLVPMFKAHIEKFTDGSPDTLLFGGADAKRIRAAFTKVRPRDDLRFHDLRHTAGTNIVAKSDITTAMAILGHSTVDTAMIYQHAVDSRKVDAMNAVAGAI